MSFSNDSALYKATNIVFLGLPDLLFKSAPKLDAQIQRIGEISNQTSKEGSPRWIIYGRVRPVGGNIIYSQTPIVKLEKQKSTSSGGKGGSSKQPDTYVERVYRSYAIRICEGPITGIIRIWRNNKLVYDARGNAWGAQNNGVFLSAARLYLGGWGQMPDPTLQSIWGAANVPAHRGTAYMVIINEDLTDLGGSVPQYLFEVERAEGAYFTSRPYHAIDVEEMDSSDARAVKFSPAYVTPAESIDSDFALSAMNFRSNLASINGGIESLDSSDFALSAIAHRRLFILYTYTNYPAESLDSSDFALTAINFKRTLITYTNYPAESIDSDFALGAINHARP